MYSIQLQRNGDVIEVTRTTAADRATNYATYNNSFRPEVLNKDIDRIWLKIQELGVADQLLKIYTERLHTEQKGYIDNQDQAIKQIIADLRNYVNQQDNSLHAKIGELRSYTDQQDNSRHSYFENLIRQQGTSLKQLDNYYKHLLIEIGKIASEKGWIASLVVDANGRNQQQINDNSTYFYATVADMVSDPYLKDGVIVGTKGYYQQHDDGGAIYLISISPTDYSIPLDNGLHAVFRDTFDIRKFGIRNDATLNQTSEIVRMIAYADSRIYEIDFHNYCLMTPKSWNWVATRGVLQNTTKPFVSSNSQVMGMTFNYCHKLKNLKIAHDKTTRLNTAHNLINFLPLENPNTEQWFVLENVSFDAWVSNYQPFTEDYLGNYDGMRHGLFCHPATGSTIKAWDETPTNISFSFINVNFESAAYSYNITTSAIHAKTVKFENLTGNFAGLYLNYMAQYLIGDKLVAKKYRNLIETGRSMVGNAIHYEAELTNRIATFELVDLNNISAFDSSTGLPASTFVYKNLGTTSIKTFRLRNNEGHARLEGVSVTDITVEETNNYSSFICLNMPRCDRLKLKNYTSSGNQGTYGSSPYLLNSAEFGEVILENSKFPTPLYPQGAGKTVLVQKMKVINSEFSSENDGLARGPSLRINDFEGKNIKISSSTGRLLSCNLGSVFIDGIRYTGDNTNTHAYLVQNTNTAAAEITIKNLYSSRSNAQWDNLIEGIINLNLYNSHFIVRPKIGSTVVLNERSVYPQISGSKVFDPPSIEANASTTTTVTASGILVGDIVQVAFSQYHADIEIKAVVTATNTVTVTFKNTGASPVNLASGTLVVKKG